jgi:DNA-binding transcriptional regulator YhcF (GntR family)
MTASEAPRDDVLGIAIDRHADIPIGVQLAWALRARVHDGRLSPGQRLPGLRDLAESLGVNVNTVRAVFQRLEQEGIVDSQQGSGTFVASTPPKPSAVGAIAADAARAAHDTGVDPREVAAALYVTPASTPQQPATGLDSDAVRRRRLRAQIASLEQTLSELESGHPGIAPAPAPAWSSDGGGPRLLDVRELEAVQAQLVRRLAAIQAAIDKLAEDAREPPTDSPQAVIVTPKRAPRKRPAARPASAGT